MKKEYIRTDKNGTRYYIEAVPCDRCGGDGIYKWGAVINGAPQYTGTCFKCGGCGFVEIETKEYTPEYRAKLDAANEKRNAKKAAARAEKHAAIEAERAEREAARAAERARKEREEAERIAADPSDYVGNEGDILTLDLTLTDTRSFPAKDYISHMEITKYVYTFRDSKQNIYVWFTTSYMWKDKYTMTPYEKGDTVKVKGIVSGHSEFRGLKQTQLKNVRIQK